MDSPLRLEIHSRGNVTDITPWTRRVVWGEGVSAPWDSMQVSLTMPLGEIGLRSTRDSINLPGAEGLIVQKSVDVSPGLWLKLTEYATGRPLSIARIDTRPMNFRASGRGTIGNRLSLSALGALQFIRTLAVETVATIKEDYGGIMALGGPAAKRYFALYQRLVKGPLPSEIVGPNGIIAQLAPVQIPSTLIPGVTTLGDLFRIAWGPGELGQAAPLRMMSRVPLSDTAALAHVMPQGTALDIILSIFQREPRLVELFPSMEAITNNHLETGYADARPTLVHRICPWITGPISRMITDTGDAPAVPISTEYDKPTWDLSRGLDLQAGEGYSLNPTRSEAGRVNVVTVNWSVAGGSPSRWLTPAGLPIADKADIERHGARLMELNWDVTAGTPSNTRPSARTFNDVFRRLSGEENAWKRLRTVGLLGWHFYGLGAVFESGTIEGPYLGLRARAGEPFSHNYGAKIPFTGYMTRVTHTVDVLERGAVRAGTSIQFDRGLWDERDRNPHLYREMVAKAPTPAQAPKQAPVAEPVATGHVLYGGQQIPWTSQAVAMEQRMRSAALGLSDRTKRPEPSDIDIFVVHFTGGWSLKIERALAVFDTGGGGTHFIIDPAGKIYQYLDLRDTAINADDNDVNRRSVSVEIMSPGAANPNNKTSAAALSPGPWQKQTGFWAGTNVGFQQKHFYGATIAQEAALAALAAFLNTNFAVALTSPARDSAEPKHLRVPRAGHRCDESVAAGGTGIAVQPGIWHHVEIKNPSEGRIDAMGIILHNIATVATGLVSGVA